MEPKVRKTESRKIEFPEIIVKKYQDCKPAYHKVYCIIKESILENALPVNLKLTEVGVSEALGVSRTPVRTALLKLKNDGVIQNITKNNIGFKQIEKKELEDLLLVARTLEGEAAFLAASRKSAVMEEEEEALKQILVELSKYSKRGWGDNRGLDGISDLLAEFYQLLAKLSGNRFLYETAVEIWTMIRVGLGNQCLPSACSGFSISVFCCTGEKLLDAIKEKNMESAKMWAETLVDERVSERSC